MNRHGALLLELPAPLLRAGCWRLRAGGDGASPGAELALPAGEYDAAIGVRAVVGGRPVSARLRLRVAIVAGRTTRLRLPVPEAWASLLAVLTMPMPMPTAPTSIRDVGQNGFASTR